MERYILAVYYFSLPEHVCVSSVIIRVLPDECVDVLMGWPGEKDGSRKNNFSAFIFHVFVIASKPN